MHARSLRPRRRADQPVLIAANDNHPPIPRGSLARRAIAHAGREPTAFVLYLLMLGLLSVAGYVGLSVLAIGIRG